jgi:hypothetical protein
VGLTVKIMKGGVFKEFLQEGWQEGRGLIDMKGEAIMSGRKREEPFAARELLFCFGLGLSKGETAVADVADAQERERKKERGCGSKTGSGMMRGG